MTIYPSYPNYRMPHDRDGTLAFWFRQADGTTRTLTGTQHRNINNESSANDSGSAGVNGSSTNPNWLTLLFPELRDITHYFLRGAHSSTNSNMESVQVSTDTTSGIDGTWTTVDSNPTAPNTTAKPGYRTEVVAITANEVKAIRFGVGSLSSHSNFATVHLYGTYSEDENPDRLRIWHPTLDEEVSPDYFDWGDIDQGTTDVRTFRIKNNSTTQSAQDIELSLEQLTGSTVLTYHSLSTDGSNFFSSINIGNLAPEAISSVLTLRGEIPETSPIWLWTVRMIVEAGDWVA